MILASTVETPGEDVAAAVPMLRINVKLGTPKAAIGGTLGAHSTLLTASHCKMLSSTSPKAGCPGGSVVALKRALVLCL